MRRNKRKATPVLGDQVSQEGLKGQTPNSNDRIPSLLSAKLCYYAVSLPLHSLAMFAQSHVAFIPCSLVLALLASGLSESSLAETFRQQVSRASQQYLQKQAASLSDILHADHFRVSVCPVVNRLKLARCPTALEVTPLTPPLTGKIHLKVSCHQKKSWSLYVYGRIQLFLPVLISSRPLAKGKTPTDTDITWQIQDIGTLPDGFFSDPYVIQHSVTQQKIKANKVLTPNMFTPQASYQSESF